MNIFLHVMNIHSIQVGSMYIKPVDVDAHFRATIPSSRYLIAIANDFLNI